MIYQVTVTMLREYSATIAIRARSQAEADRTAIAAFDKWACEEESSYQALPLGFPPPWKEHESIDHEPEIDTSVSLCRLRKGYQRAANITASRTTSGPRPGSRRMAGCCALLVSKGASDVR